LANTKQARKRAHQSEIHRRNNASRRSAFRTAVKTVVSSIASGDKGEAEQAYKDAVPVIDSTVSKGIIHKNKAARHKSRLSAHIKAL